MIAMWTTSIGRLRLVGMIEGLSYLLLLFIAMPLKYIWGDPTLVRHIGMAHGVLWTALIVLILEAKISQGWTLRQAAVPVIASLLPFGPFWIDKRLRDGTL